MMIIALFFAEAIALQDSYASRPCVQSSPLEMVEMDQIVSGKRGWVTRGLREYVGWGDRLRTTNHRSSRFPPSVN